MNIRALSIRTRREGGGAVADPVVNVWPANEAVEVTTDAEIAGATSI